MERRSRRQQDLTKILIMLIAFLSVVLIGVICVAVDSNPPDDTQPTDADSPSSSATTQSPTTTARPTDPIVLTVTPLTDTAQGTILERITFIGTADPAEPVTVNGKAVSRNADGSFRVEVPLTVGKNDIVFAHKDQTEQFSVERRYVVEFYTPDDAQDYNSGATVHFGVSARVGSTVTAEFNGKTVTLKKAANQQGSGTAEGFQLFTGEYKLTNTNTSDLDLGAVTFTAVCDGITETCVSGPIRCLKTTEIKASDPSVTPSYGNYMDVGSGYIAEVVIYAAETFYGKTGDDYSHPTNNYLPLGTVDYCSTNAGQYLTLRCGRRIYTSKKNTPSNTKTKVADCYVGKLPDHNELGFVSMETVGHHTVLTLDSMWKAPFYFDLLPQEYLRPNGGSDRSYEIVSFTATYIDITFCYATEFEGTVQIPEENPIFKSAELIRNESDCILRLHLKKTGGFYGWDCYYNDQDQLCFRFLNPAKVTAADNAYGADLTGVTVMIDVGHGGSDGGATGTDAAGTRWSESGRNMDLAYALRDELQSMGATVVFNREGKVTLTVDERIQILKNAAPDICIAIHHNSISGYPNINGFETYHFNAFSQLAAKKIYERTNASGVYKRCALAWHNYYVARQTCCPVVLTENGFMSNLDDLNGALDPAVIAVKAKAMAQGVADYFLLINQ